MIGDYFGNWVAGVIVKELAPTFLENIVSGVQEFERNCYAVPVRCRARHWMKRGEERINLKALGLI